MNTTGQEPPAPADAAAKLRNAEITAGVLLLILGVVGFLAAFAQLLSFMFYVNHWLSVVLAVAQLIAALGSLAAAALVIFRVRTIEQLSAERTAVAAMIVAGSFVLFTALASLLLTGTLSGAIMPLIVTVPLVAILWWIKGRHHLK